MKNRKGFTLVELLAVIVILGAGVALGVIYYQTLQKKTKSK